MVNTFLTDSDFRTSARNLDYRRLGKQRVEAIQILNLIEDLSFLCSYFNLPLPGWTDESPPELPVWSTIVKEIKNRYRLLPFRFVQLKVTDRSLPSSTDYTPVPLEQLGKLTDRPIRIVNLGFINHPIVRMWFGYREALKDYINAHLEEWISRGYKNRIPFYSVPSEYSRPGWTKNPTFHRTHRSALLEKETNRKENPWYSLRETFVSAGPFVGYIWY
jgi:hypothetical protein